MEIKELQDRLFLLQEKLQREIEEFQRENDCMILVNTSPCFPRMLISLSVVIHPTEPVMEKVDIKKDIFSGFKSMI